MEDVMANRTNRAVKRVSKGRHATITASEAKAPTESVNLNYARATAELDIVARQRQRRERQSSAPKVTVEHMPPGRAEIRPDHPDSDLWKAKLQASMGTVEWPFANKLIADLLNAACAGSTSQAVRQQDLNAALAAMHGISPRDEAEAMLVAQMIATHAAAMALLRRLKTCETIPQQDSAGNLATKLLRTYATQLEALARYRGKGQQTVRVEHVTVQAGGQAIVGSVNTPRSGGGVQMRSSDNPMQLPIHRAKRCQARSKRTGNPCRSPAVRGWKVCRMHGARGGAPKGKRNGNYRHGCRTAEADAMQDRIKETLRSARAFLKRL
jgi:hypothetical protein